MHCLLSLSAALQQLGVILLGLQKRDEIVREALYSLVEALVDPEAKRVSEIWHRSNLLFISKILDTWDPTWTQATGTWQTKLQELTTVRFAISDRHIILTLPAKDHAGEQVESQITEALARSQTLLGFLFPSRTRTVNKAAALLYLGEPSGGQEYQPAIEVVEPTPRLGLLLV